MKRPEQSVQIKIVNWLESNGFLCHYFTKTHNDNITTPQKIKQYNHKYVQKARIISM